MSEENYFNLLRRRKSLVTGPKTPTCLVASIDRITVNTDAPVQIYQRQSELWRQAGEGIIDKRSSAVGRMQLNEILNSLGISSSTKNISRRRAENAEELEQILSNAQQGGRRVIAWVDRHHAVGLVPDNTEDEPTWVMKSTWSPHYGPVTVPELEKLLTKDKDKKGRKLCNIMTISSEKKK